MYKHPSERNHQRRGSLPDRDDSKHPINQQISPATASRQPVFLSSLIGRQQQVAQQNQSSTIASSSGYSGDSINPQKSHIYHIVDTRSENALVGKATINFDMPKISPGKDIKDSEGRTYKGTVDYYLSHSSPGNMYTGALNIKTGQIDLYPISIDRGDMIDFGWGQKEFLNKTHDSGNAIMHPGQGSNVPVAHLQLLSKLNATDISDDYIGFTFCDTRHIRKHANFHTNSQVSMLYGASRSLNLKHVNILKNDSAAVSGANNLDAHKRNESIFTYHLPIEIKRDILTGIKAIMGNSEGWQIEIDKELSRADMKVDYYHEQKNKQNKPKPFILYT